MSSGIPFSLRTILPTPASQSMRTLSISVVPSGRSLESVTAVSMNLRFMLSRADVVAHDRLQPCRFDGLEDLRHGPPVADLELTVPLVLG